MKRRICSLALTLALLLGLAVASQTGQAATVYFTAANDTLLELNDATMPFWSGGLLYVPATAFGSGGLGISDSYNTAKKTLILRRGSFRLICNLASGMTVDSVGNAYDFKPLERGGQVFLPINEVCRIFSLSCSTRSVANGYLVRIRNESAAFSDEAFIAAASAMLTSRYQDYLASHRQEEPTPDPETTEGRSLFLALTAAHTADTRQWLDVLSGTEHHATFFLTESFFRDGDAADTLRRILAEGHTLGLAVSGDSARAVLNGLHDGNGLLEEVLCTRTRLVYTTDGTLPEIAVNEGYCAVDFDLSCEDEASLSSSAAQQLLSRAGSSARLTLGASLSAESLRTLLRAAAARGYTGLSFRETTC